MGALDRFGDAARRWFTDQFAAPTPVQERGWTSIAAGHHTLMLAPTGSGKTLAAFLYTLDRAVREPRPGTRVVYVSPIKALAYDVERNLRAPLAGLVAQGVGASLRVDVRTGDTPAAERERQRKQPGEILITTPESLYLILAGRARERLTGVDTVIVDEIHALAPTKRGIHLALTLERLDHLVARAGNREPQRIGLSATQRPLTEVARYLGGDRPVEIVDASAPPALDLQIIVPTANMDTPDPSHAVQRGMWPHIHAHLLALIRAHRATIVFVNSRRLAERVAQAVQELASGVPEGANPEPDLVAAHHGSVARHQRQEIEERMKRGALRAIVATSSLELGIDMGAVDLVVQIESPGSVARGLQRVGRAGHQVGGTSIGRILPKFRGDLLEATVIAKHMLLGEVEAVRIPDSALDVLAQQIVAMVATDDWTVAELERVIRRAASYRDLSHAAFVGVLDMLAGRYPSDEFAELRPRLTWDRRLDTLVARKGARLLAVVSGGTIPDRGTFGVHLRGVSESGGPRIGELDEEMVAESRKGDTFILGASTWRIADITRDRVIVTPAPGEPGRMPFWRGEGPGRPVELGRALGAFCRDLDTRLADDPAAARAWLSDSYRLDAFAADNLATYLADQRAATGAVPTDRAITIERFRDELGDTRVSILTPFGGRVHAPWALVLAKQLEDRLGYPVHPRWTDDGIALRFAEADAPPSDADLAVDPDDVERMLVDELARSSTFASHFRENAARALLLPRRRPGQRTPLWAQRLRAQQLMSVALRYPAFPITLETYREVLRDVYDVPALVDVLRGLRAGEIRIDSATTATASPFSRSLVFDYVAAFLYEGDAPVAERKAQALALDRTLLAELIGGGAGIGALRDLLDSAVIADVEAELQRIAPDRRARDADELADLVRRIGEVTRDELAARATIEVAPAIAALVAAGRLVPIVLAGTPYVIAVEDAARYRDALGVALPPGLPDALLAPVTGGLASLLARWARTHGPFEVDVPAARWGLPAEALDAVGETLVGPGQLVRDALRPGAPLDSRQLCDPEVLRQLRRRTLVALRAQVAPVDAATYAAFLPRWHGLDQPRRGIGALRDVLVRLEGAALPFSELEARVLPARVLDYHPRMLDELGAAGELVWIGAGALGARDGRVVLLRRARALALAPAMAELPTTPIHVAILEHLRVHGAAFFVAIEQAVARAVARDGAAGTPIKDALWELVWAGAITNDTFAPLRAIGAPASRRASAFASFGGRWSLVAALGPPPRPTDRLHALATTQLERWGVASRAAARVDDVPGGFAAIGDVFRAMEDAGTVRRGFFVAALEGAQFAWPGAIDRLRDARPGAPRIVVLAALDPACAWGSALPWPALRDPAARPTRRVGAAVILHDGALAVWVEPKAKRLATGDLPATIVEHALVVGLPQLARRARRRELLVETIDDRPAFESPFLAALQRAGARADYRGVVIPGSAAAPPAEELDDDEGE